MAPTESTMQTKPKIKSAYDEAQEILTKVNEDWADRLMPCGTDDDHMPIGAAIIHFNNYLRGVKKIDAKRRQELIVSLL